MLTLLLRENLFIWVYQTVLWRHLELNRFHTTIMRGQCVIMLLLTTTILLLYLLLFQSARDQIYTQKKYICVIKQHQNMQYIYRRKSHCLLMRRRQGQFMFWLQRQIKNILITNQIINHSQVAYLLCISHHHFSFIQLLILFWMYLKGTFLLIFVLKAKFR